MRQLTSISLKRSGAVALLLFAALACTGCVGAHKGKQLATELENSAGVVKEQTQRLQKAYAAEVAARQAADAALTASLAKSGRAQTAIIDREHQKQLALLEAAYRDQALFIIRIRQIKEKSLDDELETALAPIVARAKTAEAKATPLAENEPDAVVRAAALQAREEYLAWKLLETGLSYEAYETAFKRFDAHSAATLARLASAYEAQKKALSAARKEEIARLAAIDAKFPVGMTPGDPDAMPLDDAFDALLDYLDAVEKTGGSYKSFFTVNSFGRGSLLDDAIRGFGEGALTRVTGGDSETPEEGALKDAASDLFDLATEAGRSRLEEAGSTAIAALKSIGSSAFKAVASDVEDALGKVREKVEDKLSEADNDA